MDPERTSGLRMAGVAPQNMATDPHAYHKGLDLPLLSSHQAQSPRQQGVPDLERLFKKAKGKKSRDNGTQMEDTGKAAQQILPEQVTTVCVIVNKESQWSSSV